MDLGLSGKVALVAASSKGLGKSSALALGREGVKLAICARGEEALNASADEMRQAGAPEVLSVQADLTKADDIDRLLKTVLDYYGQVDILFTNNSGPPAGLFWEFDDASWSQSVDLTLMSAVRLIRGVLPGMRENAWGRIICSTSIAAVQPGDWANLVLTNSMRTGVHGLAKTLAHNLATEGITVNCIAPGPILTDRTDELARSRAEREGISYEEAVAAMGQLTALKRLGRVEEFGPAVAFLASEQASFITGVSLRVDGGEHVGLL
jgi:3-oxoacyl-[acyl-carrier protein] reductase